MGQFGWYNLDAHDNPNLYCVEIDDPDFANLYWSSLVSGATFNLYCGDCFAGVSDLQNTPKKLVKIVDYTGRETTFKQNIPLIYVYDDGSTEKVIVTE